MPESSTSNTVSDKELWLIVKALKDCKNIYDEQHLLLIAQQLRIPYEKVEFVAELVEDHLK